MMYLRFHVVFALLCSLTLADRVMFGRQHLSEGTSQGANGFSAEGDGSRCSSAIDTPRKGLVNDDLEGPGKDYSTKQMNILLSQVDPMFYSELVSPTKEYTILVPPRHILESISVQLSHHYLDEAMVAEILYLHILPGRYELQQLQLILSEKGMPIRTYNNEALNLTRLSTGSVKFMYGQSSATILGQAFESCKPGSLLYSMVGFLSPDDIIPNLEGWDYRGELPIQHHGRPFAQVAGMIMMFAFVLVLTLACVACCRGRRRLRGRTFFNGTFMPFGPKRGPEGPPPPPPPKVMYRLDAQRWSTLPLDKEPAQNDNNNAGGDSSQASVEGGAPPAEPSAEGCRRTADSQDLEADSCGLNVETACLICFEREGDHVLVPCGHGGYCRQCAHKVLAHPLATRLCPICRAGLSAIVQVSLDTPMGGAAKVLAASSAACAPRASTSSSGAAPPRRARLPEAASSLPGPIFVSLPGLQRQRSASQPRQSHSRDRQDQDNSVQLQPSTSVPEAENSAAADSAAQSSAREMEHAGLPFLDALTALTASGEIAAAPSDQSHVESEVDVNGALGGSVSGPSRVSHGNLPPVGVIEGPCTEPAQGESATSVSLPAPACPAAEQAALSDASAPAPGYCGGLACAGCIGDSHAPRPSSNGEIEVTGT